MGPLPSITSAQIESAIADVSDVQEIGRGGQKLVFSAVINGSRYALKILEAPGDDLESDETEFDAGSDLIIRARREVETMRQCKSRFMVKLGPIGLTQVEINGQPLVYFTEELVAGNDLHHGYVKQKKTLSGEEVVQLGLQMTNAIEAIWQLNKVHRDIKPGNIMRRENGDFVLLDAGLAFDKQGESLSGGWPVGTPIYFRRSSSIMPVVGPFSISGPTSLPSVYRCTNWPPPRIHSLREVTRPRTFTQKS